MHVFRFSGPREVPKLRYRYRYRYQQSIRIERWNGMDRILHSSFFWCPERRSEDFFDTGVDNMYRLPRWEWLFGQEDLLS